MSKDAIKRVAALGAVAALAAAPAAFAAQPADPGSQGQGGEHGNSGNAPGLNKGEGAASGQSGEHSNAGGQAVVTYVFKGTYAGNSSVDVKRGNAHVRKADMVDTTVSFDLSETSIVAKDNNDDGEITLADVNEGDKVVVKSRLPRKAAGDQPFAASQLVDQTRKTAEEPEVI
jgi:hypothetical protein